MTNILKSALKQRFPNNQDVTCTHLAGDASNRQFYLINSQEVLCIDPNFQNNLYAQSLRQYEGIGIRCPHVLNISDDFSWMFMTFVGGLYLSDHPKRRSLNIRCLDTIRPLWKSDYESLLPAMNPDFLIKEFSRLDRFFEVLQKPKLCQQWESLKHIIYENLPDSKLVSCHRDFHSRNILFKNGEDESPAIIDTQDTRLGPPHYDLASFIVDPYCDLKHKDAIEMLLAFNTDIEDPLFKYTFLQRGIKAINTYFKMCIDIKKNFYYPYIKSCIKNIELLYPDFFNDYSEVRNELWQFQKPH